MFTKYVSKCVISNYQKIDTKSKPHAHYMQDT